MEETPNYNEEHELQPLSYEFDCDGSKYRYCFNDLTADRILQAQRLFKIDFEILKNLPQLPSEIQTATERQTLRHAFAAMLMKREPHGGFEFYSPASASGFDALAYIKGKDFAKLMECQRDFFENSGLSSEYSMQQSKQAMKDALELIKGLSPEQLTSILPFVESTTAGRAGMNADVNSSLMNIISENLGNLTTGQSSGLQATTTRSKGKKS